MKKSRLALSMLAAILLLAGLVLPVAAQVEPPEVEAHMVPGESMVVEKVVTVPTLLPKADVVLSVDLTGSMGGELDNLKAEIDNLIDALALESADLNIGIVSHEDYPHYYDYGGYSSQYGWEPSGDQAFRVDYAIGSDFDAAAAAVAGMALKNGADGPESYARVMWESGHADNLMGYRDSAQRIMVMFLDSVPHDLDLYENGTTNTGIDPGRDEEAGTADDIDFQDDAIQAMVDEGIALLVVCSGGSTLTSYWNNWAGETGGAAVEINPDGTVPGGISLTELIMDLIKEVTTDVWPVVEADPSLDISFEPEYFEGVESGETVIFMERITVAEDATRCRLHASVTFYANSYPDEGAVVGTEKILIHIPDVIPPKVWCVEAENPHGQNTPPAGSETLPGPKGGKNPDGFYQLLARDNCNEPEEIEIYVNGFGPFSSGDIVKITEAPGAEPNCKKMGSTKGEAGAVAAHITLPADPVITAVDTSGNVGTCTGCLVPPPPQ